MWATTLKIFKIREIHPHTSAFRGLLLDKRFLSVVLIRVHRHRFPIGGAKEPVDRCRWRRFGTRVLQKSGKQLSKLRFVNKRGREVICHSSISSAYVPKLLPTTDERHVYWTWQATHAQLIFVIFPCARFNAHVIKRCFQNVPYLSSARAATSWYFRPEGANCPVV